MSVFTALSLQEAQSYLRDFPIGEVTALKGIVAGVTNTNYFVDTASARYVLTIFEANHFEELPYFVGLMAHLADHDIPCPAPIADKHGHTLQAIKGKPALLVTCLKGSDVKMPDTAQCAQVGHGLAKIHLAGDALARIPTNQRDEAWRKSTAVRVMEQLPEQDQSLLKRALALQAKLDLSDLPAGVIHGDLFRDNVLFDGAKLGGFIDFYYACHDVLAYDVAIAVNDWCLLETGEIDEPRLQAFLRAYTAVRPFTQAEKGAWHGLLSIAALRFWLSRLYDLYFPAEGELTHAKDPNYFKHILLKSLERCAL